MGRPVSTWEGFPSASTSLHTFRVGPFIPSAPCFSLSQTSRPRTCKKPHPGIWTTKSPSIQDSSKVVPNCPELTPSHLDSAPHVQSYFCVFARSRAKDFQPNARHETTRMHWYGEHWHIWKPNMTKLNHKYGRGRKILHSGQRERERERERNIDS